MKSSTRVNPVAENSLLIYLFSCVFGLLFTLGPAIPTAAAAFPHAIEQEVADPEGLGEEDELLKMSLEELMDIEIVSASLREEKLSEAAAPIYIVTARDILERGYMTLKDVMEDVPGFVDLSDSNENIVGVRGAYASTTNKILILVNGHRMNSLGLGRYNTDQFFGMDTVERIEFIMGPGSVLYGTGALVGVVNIITKTGADAPGLFGQLRVGTFHNEGTVSFGTTTEDLDLFASLTYLDGDGDEIRQPAAFDVVPSGQTPASGHIYWNRYPENWSALVSLRYKNTDIHFRRAHSARATPRVPNGSFYDYSMEKANGFPPLYSQDDTFFDVLTRIELGEKTELVFNPSFHVMELEEKSWISAFGANRLPPLGSRSGQDTREMHWRLKSYVDHSFGETIDGMLGIDFLCVDFQKADGLVISNGTDTSITPERIKLETWPLFGAFGQMSWQPVDKVKLNMGLRFDSFNGEADARLTPRLGVVYTPTESLSLKALYGESYLSPQWDHKNLNPDKFAFVSNPGLDPEELRSGDLIVQYQRENFSGWVDVFVHDIDGIITPSQTGTGKQIYVNFGHSQYWGSETGAHYDLNDTWRLTGSYSFVNDTGHSDSQFKQDGYIKNVPRHILRYGLRCQPMKELTVTLWGRTYSKVEASDPITGNNKIDPWTSLDLTAVYEKNDLLLSLKVSNLTDEEYEVGGTVVRPMARPGTGLMFSVGYRY